MASQPMQETGIKLEVGETYLANDGIKMYVYERDPVYVDKFWARSIGHENRNYWYWINGLMGLFEGRPEYYGHLVSKYHPKQLKCEILKYIV